LAEALAAGAADAGAGAELMAAWTTHGAM
jgi:hypothetical protein